MKIINIPVSINLMRRNFYLICESNIELFNNIQVLETLEFCTITVLKIHKIITLTFKRYM